MRKVIISALIFMGVIAIFYVIGAFISWEINPQKWDKEGRLIMVLFSFLFSAFSIGLYNQINSNK